MEEDIESIDPREWDRIMAKKREAESKGSKPGQLLYHPPQDLTPQLNVLLVLFVDCSESVRERVCGDCECGSDLDG